MGGVLNGQVQVACGAREEASLLSVALNPGDISEMCFGPRGLLIKFHFILK